jgi:hypothetical protein
MRLNLRIASLLVVIGVFGFSSTVLAQTNKKTTNKAQAKTGTTTAATPKKTKNPNTGEVATPKRGNTRPPSTGTGNGNNRPPSTGENLSDIELLDRVEYGLFALRQDLNMYELNNWDNSGLNAQRATDFATSAYNKAKDLRDKYMELNGGWHDAPFYNINEGYEMRGVKNGLEILLNHLNNTEFESNGLKSDVKDKIQQAIAQVYLDNPPAKTKPTKKAPNGAKTANPNRTSQSANGQQQMIKSDTSLKTTPAGVKNAGEINPCETQSSNSGSNKTAKAKGKNQKTTTTTNGVTSPAGTWECAKANEKSTQPKN